MQGVLQIKHVPAFCRYVLNIIMATEPELAVSQIFHISYFSAVQ